MLILPAIDFKDGCCVRVRQDILERCGSRGTAAAMAAAQSCFDAGVRYLYCTDLDGTQDGKRVNFPLIDCLVRRSDMGVLLDGAVQNEPDLITAVGSGVSAAVIHSAAVTNPKLVDYAVTWCPDQVAVGIDCLDGEMYADLDYLEFAKSVAAKGVKDIIFTDTYLDRRRDTLPAARIAALLEAVPGCNVIFRGAISSLDDVKRLRDLGVYGAVLRQAYYSGAIGLPEAVKAAGPQE